MPAEKNTLENLLKIAVEKKASDMHLVVGKPPIFRIDGELTEMEKASPLTPERVKELSHSVLSPQLKEELIREKGVDISYGLEKKARFRLNISYEKENMVLAARVIPLEIPTMESIRMPESVYHFLNLKQGLILITGPSGCGKSTTLAAMINFINQEMNRRIITLEDPIEFVFSSQKSIITQRELGRDMLSFAEALRHALRQDPNIVMVGEMRDPETIATTMTLAETGHLIFATLHTPNSSLTIDRIIDTFPPHQQAQIRSQLSMVLKCVISQQLLPAKAGGRLAAREILVNIPAIANLIRDNKINQIRNTLHTNSGEGMFTLDQDLIRLYKGGFVDREAAEFYMENSKSLG